MKSRTLVYLASPYSSPDAKVRQANFLAACAEAAHLMAHGHLVFSPIAHTHPIAVTGSLPTGWSFWERYDRRVIEACDEVWVLKLAGWRTSVGVKAEVAIAKELGKPVRLVYPTSVCDRCGKRLARHAGGVWKHGCQGLLPTMRPADVKEAIA